MPSNLPTTSYAVMGLLSFNAMSGYELTGFIEQSIAHFWPIAKSQVYGELARLEDLGYVESSDVKQERLPDKRIYSLTETGSKVLDEWLADAEFGSDRFRVSFLVKYFFGHRMPKASLISMLQSYRERSQKMIDEIRPFVEEGITNDAAFYPMTAALFGLRHLEANVSWTEEILAKVRHEEGGKR
jgi:PadR family transcriptional regulator AphA